MTPQRGSSSREQQWEFSSPIAKQLSTPLTVSPLLQVRLQVWVGNKRPLFQCPHQMFLTPPDQMRRRPLGFPFLGINPLLIKITSRDLKSNVCCLRKWMCESGSRQLKPSWSSHKRWHMWPTLQAVFIYRSFEAKGSFLGYWTVKNIPEKPST